MYQLYKFDKNIKRLLLAFTLTCTMGVSTGIYYLYHTTSMTPGGTINRFNGSNPPAVNDDFDIPTHYPKPVGEMLLTTHNHILAFSFIFLPLGLIFLGSTLITSFWKSAIAVEPFLSVIITFSSLWAVRFIHPGFVYLTVLSATFMYSAFYVMAGAITLELLFKTNHQQ